MTGFILLGVWMFILYTALYARISDLERKIDILLEEECEDGMSGM